MKTSVTIEDLRNNIRVLDALIERYGANRSLTNIRDSEKSILKSKAIAWKIKTS